MRNSRPLLCIQLSQPISLNVSDYMFEDSVDDGTEVFIVNDPGLGKKLFGNNWEQFQFD